MSELVFAPQASSPSTEAYPLRGHHLENFTLLMPPFNTSPSFLGMLIRDTATSERGNMTLETVDFSILEGDRDPANYRAAYGLDLVGETVAQGDAFEDSVINEMKQFLNLTDDKPIEIVAGKKDGICDSCIFQNHCATTDMEKRDVPYLNIFEDVANHFASIDDQVDAPVRTSEKAVLTNAKTTKRILGYFAIAGDRYVQAYGDAIRRHNQYGNVFAGPGSSTLEAFMDLHGVISRPE